MDAEVLTAETTTDRALPAAASIAVAALEESLAAAASTAAAPVVESLPAAVSDAAATVDHPVPAAVLTTAAATAAIAVEHSVPAAVSTAAPVVEKPPPAENPPAADAAAPQIVDLAQFGRIHHVSAGTGVVRRCSVGATTVSDATDAESILSLDLSDEAARLDLADVPWFSR